MTRATYAVLSVVLVFSGGAALRAHHSFAAHYDMQKAITVQGSLVGVRLSNPHSWFYLDVKEADGTLSRWSFEAGTPSGMIRNGYNKSELPPGTMVTITGFHARDQAQKVGMLRQLTTADGRTFGMFGPQEGAGARLSVMTPLAIGATMCAVARAALLRAALVTTAVALVPHTVLAQQRGTAPAPAPQAAQPAQAAPGPAPRMADGKPDLSGVWWTGGDVGGRGYGGGRGRGGGAPAGPPPATITSLYKPDVVASNKKLNDNNDPTLKCVPTAMGTLNVSLFDVGAVGQIVATPKFVVMLTETFHGWRVVPTDGRPHRAEVPPSYRGDSVGRWDGDVFVMETKNFTDDTWMWAEGRVSPHSDELRIVERYRRVNANTLEIEATVHDPKMLTAPWVVPKQTLTLAPFDQIMPLVCLGLGQQ